MKKDKPASKDSGHSFEDYIKRAANPLLVLLLLRERPMYVYEMAQALEDRSDGRYSISLLYPVLYRLTSQGYVQEGEKKVSEDNRVRQYYEITPEGIAYYEQICNVYDQMMATIQKIRDSGVTPQ